MDEAIQWCPFALHPSEFRMPLRASHTAVFFLLMAVFAQLALAGEAAAAGRWIVVLRDDASPVAAAKRHGASPDYLYGSAIHGYAATLSDAALAKARKDPAVMFVAPDRVISLGKPGGGGGGGTTSTQVVPTGIARIGAATVRTDGVSGNEGYLTTTVDVGVVDTGIDGSHPDLNVVGGVNCSSGASWADGNGHGTHVSGTIGAKDNNLGVVGVMPGVRLWAYRVLNNAGSGTTSSVVCGLNQAAANAQIDVVNLSLGGAGTRQGTCQTTSDPMYAAICALTARHVTVVVAAGNESADASTSTPAAYPEPITVSAWSDFNGSSTVDDTGTKCRADMDETFADFSNYGTVVDLAAPGVCIRSTWKGGAYNTISGTSMATPHVTGAAALWRALHPGADEVDTWNGIEANLELHASPVADDPDDVDEGLLSIRGW
jgi:subtilisin family serine protease